MTRQAGFTLLEVLIAVVVLAVGLLGLAKLQTTGLRQAHSSNLRTQATLLAYDITDRIRTNRQAYIDAGGQYVDPPVGVSSMQCAWEDSTVDDCSPEEMARFDLAQWQDAIAESLPDGLGIVCLDSTPEDGWDVDGDGVVSSSESACDGSVPYAVKIWWTDEFNAEGEPVIKRFVTSFLP